MGVRHAYTKKKKITKIRYIKTFTFVTGKILFIITIKELIID